MKVCIECLQDASLLRFLVDMRGADVDDCQVSNGKIYLAANEKDFIPTVEVLRRHLIDCVVHNCINISIIHTGIRRYFLIEKSLVVINF